VVAAAGAGIVAYLARMPLMLAYIAAGVALGPYLGFSVVQSSESISALSSIGLVLLMFILGLEIDINKLLQAGKAVIVNGITQFLGCVAFGLLFFYVLGYRNGEGKFELVYLAVACGLSSTLIVVKILSDRMELDTLTSRISLGILVLQDLWAIAFLAVQPNLNNLQPSVLAISAGKAVGLVATSLLVSRYILPPIFARASKQPELLLVVAMGWCFAMCGLAEQLHLSLEMGALTAGIGIASFPYHTDVAAKVSALRDFFITLFFVALGMQIPKPTGEVLVLTGAIVAFVLFSRVLVVFPVLYFMKYGNRASVIPGLNISQVSEFALVLAAIGAKPEFGHIGQPMLSAFILALVVTCLLSSLMIPKGHAIAQALNPILEKLGFKDKVSSSGNTGINEAVHVEHPRIVLLGFFREASSLLNELSVRHSEDVRKKVLVVDFNPEAHKKLNEAGYQCKYGDLSHPDTLKHLELEHAKVLICTIPDHILKGTSNLTLVKALKKLAPEAEVIVTAETLKSAHEMYEAGADYVFLPRMLSANYLADLLDHIHAGTDAAFKSASKEKLKEWKEVLG
jgi:Kef-type K+ transport system membrane component KefB